MKSWPTTYLPPLGPAFSLPPLRMKATRGSEEIATSHKEIFSMYVCGITPYDATHLGHAATYLTFDLLNRYVRARGATVAFVENITDIDDPLLERATRDQVDWKDLAQSQIDLYKADMTALHILPPKDFVPVTDVMKIVERAVSKLSERGFTYLVENDIYFDTSQFIADLPIAMDEALRIFAERGGDPERANKRHPLDPVLWIANRPGEPGWESIHGNGRPGWHIECSVIALNFLLGENFLEIDNSQRTEPLISLQGGGSDLIFPHHFMSAAQAQALTGRPFARSYIHTGMVGLDGEKMSKSKGNLVFVSRLLESGRDPMSIRYALLSDHYSSDRMWSEAVLLDAESKVASIRSALSRESCAGGVQLINTIINSLADDLNTPKALAAIEDWAGSVQEGPDSTGEVSRALDLLLGLAL